MSGPLGSRQIPRECAFWCFKDERLAFKGNPAPPNFAETSLIWIRRKGMRKSIFDTGMVWKAIKTHL
jgi:hypothetical protein